MDEKESEKVVEEATESKDETVAGSPKKVEDVSETVSEEKEPIVKVEDSTSEAAHINNVDDVVSSSEILKSEESLVKKCEDELETIAEEKSDVAICENNIDHPEAIDSVDLKGDNADRPENVFVSNLPETEKVSENPVSPELLKSADILSLKSLIDDPEVEKDSSLREDKLEESEDAPNPVSESTSTIDPIDNKLLPENKPFFESAVEVTTKEIFSPLVDVAEEPELEPISSGEDSNNKLQAESAHCEENVDSLSRVENVSPKEILDSELDDQNIKSPDVSEDKQHNLNDSASENNSVDVSVNSADIETFKLDNSLKDDDANFKSNESLQNGPDKSPGNNEMDDEEKGYSHFNIKIIDSYFLL